MYRMHNPGRAPKPLQQQKQTYKIKQQIIGTMNNYTTHKTPPLDEILKELLSAVNNAVEEGLANLYMCIWLRKYLSLMNSSDCLPIMKELQILEAYKELYPEGYIAWTTSPYRPMVAFQLNNAGENITNKHRQKILELSVIKLKKQQNQ